MMARKRAKGLTERQMRILEVLERFQAHNRAVTSLAFSPDGALLASGGLDSVLRLWKINPGSAGN